MGTTRTDYVMLAAKLPFNIIPFEKLEPYEDNGYNSEITVHNSITSVSDGMGGEYIFLGRVMEKAIEPDGLAITNCRDYTNAEINHIRALIKNLFGLNNVDISVWAFTHWH